MATKATSEVSSVAQSALQPLADAAASAYKWALESALTFSMSPHVQSPNVDANSGPIHFLQIDTIWFAGFAGVVGFLFAAIRLVIERRAEPAKQVVRGIFNIAFSFTAALTVIHYGEEAGDLYAQWIIGNAIGHGANLTSEILWLANRVGNFSNYSLLNSIAKDAVPALIVIVASFMGFMGGLSQLFLQIYRDACLDILAAVIPITAAASTTNTGAAMHRKQWAWTTAYVLYPFVAAPVLAMAIWLAKSPNGMNEITGAVLFFVSPFSIYPIMRLVVPLVSQATVQDGAGMAGAASPVIRSAAWLAAPIGAIRAIF